MDIWEANDISTAYTPHPCVQNSQHSCKGDNCGGTYSANRYAGDCDPDGCDFNSYRQGNTTFYGPGGGFTVDTTKKMSVVTQFLKGSDGALSEIKRFYVQNGKAIPNSESDIAGLPGNSVKKDFCDAQKRIFENRDSFAEKGGLAQMSKAVAAPMVLVMSLWDDVSHIPGKNLSPAPSLSTVLWHIIRLYVFDFSALLQHALAGLYLSCWFDWTWGKARQLSNKLWSPLRGRGIEA